MCHVDMGQWVRCVSHDGEGREVRAKIEEVEEEQEESQQQGRRGRVVGMRWD